VKKMIIALFAVMLMVPTLALGWAENNIGLYVVPNPTGDDAEASLIATGAGGHTLYLVLSTPHNFNTDATIVNLSGFELSLSELPPGWSIGEIVLPEGVLDLDGAQEHFFCSGAFPPAVGNDIVLAEVPIGTFDAAPSGGPVFMAPYFTAPSIPGHMAITDGDDAHSLSPAFPSSGDYGQPIFGINMAVVPTEDTSWGSVKSMFQ